VIVRYPGLPRSTQGNALITDGVGNYYHVFTTVGSSSITLSNIPSQEGGLFGRRYSGYFSDNVNYFSGAPLSSQVDQSINNLVESTNNISWEWLGYFRAPTTGTYTFTTVSDDASYVWVGANAVSNFTTANATVNNGGLHAAQSRSGTFAMTAGLFYAIRVQYGQGTGDAVMTLSFSGPGITATTNGDGFFFYNTQTNGI
jgi:hypothetical protein